MPNDQDSEEEVCDHTKVYIEEGCAYCEYCGKYMWEDNVTSDNNGYTATQDKPAPPKSEQVSDFV